MDSETADPDGSAQEVGADRPPLADPVRELFTGLPATFETQLNAIAEIQAAGSLVAEMLASHSYLTGDDASRTAAELFFADDGPNFTPEWASLRADYVAKAMVLATTIAVADPATGDHMSELAIRVGFGLDLENKVLRDRLFGPIGRQVDLTLLDPLPYRDIDFPEIFRRTCLVGVQHALVEFGRAASNVPRESSTAIIESIRPARGCAGDWLEIRGHGFGSSQPPGVTLAFTAYAGGLVNAGVNPANWGDGLIRVQAPAGVGKGPVGFLREGGGSGSGHTVASAAGQLAGEVLACLGRPAFAFVQRLGELGARLDAPHISSTDDNRFAGGPPRLSGSSGTVRLG